MTSLIAVLTTAKTKNLILVLCTNYCYPKLWMIKGFNFKLVLCLPRVISLSLLSLSLLFPLSLSFFFFSKYNPSVAEDITHLLQKQWSILMLYMNITLESFGLKNHRRH